MEGGRRFFACFAYTQDGRAIEVSLQLVHCSDLHLGKRFNISNYSHALERRRDLERNFSNIVEYSLENKPDLFLIGGDVYDRILPTNPERVFLTEKIRALKDAGIHVFMIGGNHDVPKSARVTNLAIEPLQSAGLATVFSGWDSIQHRVVKVDGRKVCISGKSYNAINESQNPLTNQKIPRKGDYNVLMLHAAFQGLNVESSVPAFANQNPIRTANVGTGLNYLALGHYHNYFTRKYRSCTICNPGSIEKITWAEQMDEKGFIWAELSKGGTNIEFVPLETRPMISKELLLSKDSGTIKEFVSSFLKEFIDSETIIRLFLKGKITGEQHQRFKVNELYRFAQENFFHFDLNRSELEVEGYGRVFMGRIDNPVEAYIKRLDVLIEKAPAEDKTFLNQVKELGIKYLGATA
jgi:DNA repair exonuclease SbcCD nuclease subunit